MMSQSNMLMGPPPTPPRATKTLENKPGDYYDVMNFNIRVWEFPVAVQSMQKTIDETVDTKSTFDFVWGMNVGLAGKWQITFLNNRKPFNPVFGVVLHLVETGVHPDQPMFGIFDVEIRKSDGSTFLHALGKPENLHEPRKVTGFRRLVSIPSIINSDEKILVDKEHLNLHMTFKLFGPEFKSAMSKFVTSTGLSHSLLDLLNSEENWDLRILLGDNTSFKAHKLILSARSPFLKKQFQLPVGTQENWDMQRIPLVKVQTLRQVLIFMYGGVLLGTWKQNYVNLIATADLLELRDLLNLLDGKLVEICVEQNSQHLLQLAKQFKLRRAEDDVKMKIQKWAQQKAQNEPTSGTVISMELD